MHAHAHLKKGATIPNSIVRNFGTISKRDRRSMKQACETFVVWRVEGNISGRVTVSEWLAGSEGKHGRGRVLGDGVYGNSGNQ